MTYVKRFPRLRGGWDVGAEEYRALGFTIGLPPNIYVPQTQPIVEISQRFETCDSPFTEIDSYFSIQDRQFLYQDGHSIRCFVRDLPPDIDAEKLKRVINQKMYQKRLTSTQECVEKVLINPMGQFAFVDFAKSKDAERFIELRDSLDIDGHVIRIRRSHNSENGVTEVPQERQNSLILWGLPLDVTEETVRADVSKFAKVSVVEIPKKDGVGLGYAIVDLEDGSLTDIVALKLRFGLGLDARRCFPWIGQSPRLRMPEEELQERQDYGVTDTAKYTTLVDGGKDMTVADALNLDIPITKVTNEYERGGQLCRLRIFNVMRSDNPDEVSEVLKDMENELRRIGNPESVFVDALSEAVIPCLGLPVVAVYATPHEAERSQRAISGRKYRGRVVITMLE